MNYDGLVVCTKSNSSPFMIRLLDGVYQVTDLNSYESLNRAIYSEEELTELFKTHWILAIDYKLIDNLIQEYEKLIE